MKLFVLLFSLVLLSLTACKEVYNPDVKGVRQILVVDGLITNDTASYDIKLSKVGTYSSTSNSAGVPELNAQVTITDDQGNIFQTTGDSLGNYHTDPNRFIGKPGNTYILHITTNDGSRYESDPQFLKAPSVIDSIYGKLEYLSYLVYEGGSYDSKVMNGIQTFVNAHSNKGDSVAGCRFDISLLLEYHIYVPGVNPLSFADWFFQSINSGVELTGNPMSSGSSYLYNEQSLGFFPTDLNIYGLSDYGKLKQYSNATLNFDHYVLFINNFSLNKATYNYYQKISNQLSNQGGLFSPIGSQIPGNILCLTDSSQIVLGHFEASSRAYKAYLIGQVGTDYVEYKNYNADLDKIVVPKVGESNKVNVYPSFWIF